METAFNKITENYSYDDVQNRIIRLDDLKIIVKFDDGVTYEMCDCDEDVAAINYFAKEYNIKEDGYVINL